jgi:hypothetical protein
MAAFTGITAAHANDILGQSVVSGAINGSGHLILTRQNGSTIDAGDFTSIVTGILTSQVAAQIATSLPPAVAGTVLNLGNVSGVIDLTPALNIDNILNAMVKVTATGNVTLNIADLPSAPRANTQFVLRLQQDATGGRTFTLTGFKKSLGSVPVTLTPNAIDLIVFLYDGTNWLAGLMGADFK